MTVVARVLLQLGTVWSWMGSWVPREHQTGCASHHGVVSSPDGGLAEVAARVYPSTHCA